MKYITIVVITIALLFSTAHATVWYVHPDSTLNSIQAGIGLCSTGDTVLVGAGTYIENINFNGMAITVASEYGPDTTIIDAGSPAHPDTGSAAIFVSSEDTMSVLEGLTLTNGSGTVIPGLLSLGGAVLCRGASPTIRDNIIMGNNAFRGGGVACLYNASPVIDNNIISYNNADGSGGGVWCYYAPATIINNTITNDSAIYGGGILKAGMGGSIVGNNISDNYAGIWGGGISCEYNSYVTIRRNTFTHNTAVRGGGIDCADGTTPTIDSCTIADNDGNGINCGSGADPVIHCCNIYNNTGYGVFNEDSGVIVVADSNWWGDPTGPYHSTNSGGLGDTVSNYVDFDPWLTDSVQGIGIEEIEIAKPSMLKLQASPNPFRHTTNIGYEICDMGYEIQNGSLDIYDATGRLVKSLDLTSHISNHTSQIRWDGTDQLNRQLGSGVYFIKLSVGDRCETRKVLLIK